MNVMIWHQHGSWTTAFVQGPHTYVLPVLPDRGPDGRGRARTWDWPASAQECPPEQLRDRQIDCVVLQRPRELELVRSWLGREPGRDLPAVYLEHDTPPAAVDARHPMAGRRDIPIVHVTHFNAVFWDNGIAPSEVIEHGVIDPDHRYRGDLARAAVVSNDPLTRGRTVGTDLLTRFTAADVGLDVFGMRVTGLAAALGAQTQLAEYEDLPQAALHQQLARRRVYLHLTRWTSLGLSLVEAMMLGLPVAVLAATEAAAVVPPQAGVVATDIEQLVTGTRELLRDPERARAAGTVGRQAALARFGLARFLADWDRLLAQVTA